MDTTIQKIGVSKILDFQIMYLKEVTYVKEGCIYLIKTFFFLKISQNSNNAKYYNNLK